MADIAATRNPNAKSAMNIPTEYIVYPNGNHNVNCMDRSIIGRSVARVEQFTHDLAGERIGQIHRVENGKSPTLLKVFCDNGDAYDWIAEIDGAIGASWFEILTPFPLGVPIKSVKFIEVTDKYLNVANASLCKDKDVQYHYVVLVAFDNNQVYQLLVHNGGSDGNYCGDFSIKKCG